MIAAATTKAMKLWRPRPSGPRKRAPAIDTASVKPCGMTFIAALQTPPRTTDPPEERRVVTLHGTSWRTSERRRILNHLGDLAAAPTPRLGRAVRAARPDVVHTHNLPGLSTAVWGAAAAAGARVVHTLHDYYLLCPRVTLVAPSGDPCRRGTYCT